MRNSFIALALGSLLACSIAPTLSAQDNPQYQSGSGHHGRGQGGMNPDRQLERLTKELGLSSDQQAQIRPILVDRQQKFQTLMQDQSLSEQDRRQKMRGIAEESRHNIQSWLNPDQKQKFEEMHHRGGPQGQGGQDGPGQFEPQPQQ